MRALATIKLGAGLLVGWEIKLLNGTEIPNEAVRKELSSQGKDTFARGRKVVHNGGNMHRQVFDTILSDVMPKTARFQTIHNEGQGYFVLKARLPGL